MTEPAMGARPSCAKRGAARGEYNVSIDAVHEGAPLARFRQRSRMNANSPGRPAILAPDGKGNADAILTGDPLRFSLSLVLVAEG